MGSYCSLLQLDVFGDRVYSRHQLTAISWAGKRLIKRELFGKKQGGRGQGHSRLRGETHGGF